MKRRPNLILFKDSLIHVPLVLRVPGVAPGAPCGQLVEMTDLYATILDIAGVESQHYHFSRSLLPLMRGENIRPRDAVSRTARQPRGTAGVFHDRVSGCCAG